MKIHNILTWLTLFFTILMTFSPSNANQTQPVPHLFKISMFPTKFQDQKLNLAPSMVLAGVFSFIAASISSAGGIGGGGLFIPILSIVAGLDLKTASSFSALMVTGGSMANVMCNLFATSAKFGGKALIDYDIALLSEPCMLLGVSIGVICNIVFPEWLITILFAIFLAWSTFKTCNIGVLYWKLESEDQLKRIIGCGNLEKNGSINGSEETNITKTPLLAMEENNNTLRFPWMKIGVLIMIWFSFSSLYLVRGNRYGEGLIPMEPCGMAYWVLSSLQIPIAIIFTAWILLRKDQTTNQQDIAGTQDKFIFPIMALLAGVLGGVFGIGGGMLISPLLLHVGIAPKVTAATCSLMVFFSSTMSALQYLLLGMEHIESALIYAIICFIASLLGLLVVQRAIKKYGRASLIVFSVGIVMALSTVLMTGFGALDVWRDYKSGKRMGFNMPC